MAWLQLTYDSSRDQAPDLEDALLELGAASVTLQDNADEPVLEPGVGERPLWSETRVVALFPADTDLDPVRLGMMARFPALGAGEASELADQVWERAWIDAFHPMQFGRRLWICPSWTEIDADADTVVLKLDPGLAFGTGTHATTALCLQWLDEQPLAGCTVIDYGCGSGILAIAALLLGAERAVGVDIDPQALVASRDNARRNGIADERFALYTPETAPRDMTADVLVANILAGPLQTMAPRLINHTRPGGRLALSGLVEAQCEPVMSAYRPACEFDPPALQDGWARLSGRRSV